MISRKLLNDLLPNEQVLFEGEGVVLTTHRLRSYDQFQLKSLMLTEINSCSVRLLEHRGLLLAALLFLLAGIIFYSAPVRNEGISIAGITLAVLFVVAYIRSRHGLVVVAADTMTISITYNEQNWENMLELVNEIEEAKHYAQQREVKLEMQTAQTAQAPLNYFEPPLG